MLVIVVKMRTPRTEPHDRAAAAAEEGAADDGRGDGVELVQVAVGVLAGAYQHDQQEGGDAAAQPGQEVEEQSLAPDVDAA